MNTFRIGNTDFGVGEITLEIDAQNSTIAELEIIGDEETYDTITEDDDAEWSWTLYPPKFYLYDVPFKKSGNVIEAEINDEVLENSDVALYMMEHNDFYGIVIIRNQKQVEIKGTVTISDQEYPLEIQAQID